MVINLNTAWHTTAVCPPRRRNDVSDGRTALGLGFYYLVCVVTSGMPGKSSGFTIALSLIPRRSTDGVPPRSLAQNFIVRARQEHANPYATFIHRKRARGAAYRRRGGVRANVPERPGAT